MTTALEREYGVTWDQLLQLGLALVLLGSVLMLLAALLPLASSGRVRGEAGGVILVGPVPIVFGTTKRMAELAMLIAGVMLLLTLTTYAWLH